MANPPLLVGAYGDDVARLHRLLRQQGYQLPASSACRAPVSPQARARLNRQTASGNLRLTRGSGIQPVNQVARKPPETLTLLPAVSGAPSVPASED
jgi:hypothetical protein